MNVDELVKRLQQDLGDKLTSVVLYGSAAAGDHAGKRSDYNVLVVAADLGSATLDAMSGTARRWVRSGNPPPLLFTLERLKQSADVFPIELLDIKSCHRVLCGEDVIEQVTCSEANLRLELEHELKGKLIGLREQYLLTGGKPGAVADLMIESLSTFQVLFRAALRLYRDTVPQQKQEAAEQLAAHIEFDPGVVARVLALKSGEQKQRDLDTADLFRRYIAAVEQVVDAVDAFLHREDGGEA